MLFETSDITSHHFLYFQYQPLRTLMVRFAVMKKIELSYLRFQFDGEDLLPADTPASLDMEDGDCIDAIEL